MRHIGGLVMLAAAAWLLRLALARRNAPAAPRHESLRALADAAPGIIIFGLVVAALQVTVAFVMTNGGGGWFSYLDLAGFLALLAAYGYWIRKKTAR